MISKALYKSMRIIPVNRPDPSSTYILSVKYERQVSIKLISVDNFVLG